jgi:hypothetical protein
MADARPATQLPDLATRVEWYDSWEEKTSESQKLARRDRAYYDGDQWTREEVDKLEERGQPVLIKNRIARKINFILGEEIRKRIDPVARPRTPQHEDSARAATDALRYVEEEQQFDSVRSAVLKNCLIEGYGGALKEIEQEEDGAYKHGLRHVEWDRLFYDPHSRAPDFSDARYLGIVVWMDLDDAIAEWPDAAEDLHRALSKDLGEANDTHEDTPRAHRWADKRRQRIKVAEMYFRVGRDYYRSVFIESADVEKPQKTAYLDEKGRRSLCPLVMMSCYVDQDGARYGVVRALVSPQDEVNKRASKALHSVSMRQVIAEKEAIRDPQKFQTELAKPDGFAEVEAGALTEGRLQVNTAADMAQGNVALLQEAKADIDTIGPSSSALADLPGSASGRAFIARQQAAAQELGTIFDQLKSWTRQVFMLDWCCIRQYWTEEKWLRVTDDQELTGYRFVALNQQMTRAQRLQELLQNGAPLPSALQTAAGNAAPQVLAQSQQMMQAMAAQAQQQAQATGQQAPPPGPEQLVAVVMQHPLMAEPITLNQVDQMLVDIVLDEAPDTAVIEMEEFENLAEIAPTIVGARPDMAQTMTRLLIKASQLRSKRELLQELDKAPDPQAMQEQQQAKAIQQAMAQAKVAVDQTRAQLQQAQTQKTAAEAQAVTPRAQAEVESLKAGSMVDAASAGNMMVPDLPRERIAR